MSNRIDFGGGRGGDGAPQGRSRGSAWNRRRRDMLPMEMMAPSSLPGLFRLRPGAPLRPGIGMWMLALSWGAACEEGPPIQALGPFLVQEPVVDFGQVFEGTLLEHEWGLRLRSGAIVREAKTDCGCTLARLEREGAAGREPYELGAPLSDGDWLHVSLRYDTRGRGGASQRAVTLVTDGGEAVALSLGSDIRPWLTFRPAPMPFSRLLEGTGTEVAFEVQSTSGDPFGLVATRVALPRWVTITLQPEGPGADGRAARWGGVARLGSETPRGTFSYPIELVTDVEIPGSSAAGAPRTFTISPAWGIQVLGPVALSAPNLEFGLVRGDETVARSVQLESFDPGFEPNAATARLEPLHEGDPFPLVRTARVRTRPAGRTCEIEVVLEGLDRELTGTFLAKLVVETGHPALPRLDALVRGVRAPEGPER